MLVVVGCIFESVVFNISCVCLTALADRSSSEDWAEGAKGLLEASSQECLQRSQSNILQHHLVAQQWPIIGR